VDALCDGYPSNGEEEVAGGGGALEDGGAAPFAGWRDFASVLAFKRVSAVVAALRTSSRLS
jgi:hypothetical protein